MKPQTIAARLFDRLRRGPARAEPDFADCGTALALDLSISASPAGAAGAGASAAEAAAWWAQLASQRPAPGL